MDRRQFKTLRKLFLFIAFVTFAGAAYAQRRIEVIWRTVNDEELKIVVFYDLVDKKNIKVTKLVNESDYPIQFSLVGGNDAEEFKLKPLSIKKCDFCCSFVYAECQRLQISKTILSPKTIGKMWDEEEKESKKQKTTNKRQENDAISKNSQNLRERMGQREYKTGNFKLRLSPVNKELIRVTQIQNLFGVKYYVRLTKNDTGKVVEYLLEPGESVQCDKIAENVIAETFDRRDSEIIWSKESTKLVLEGRYQAPSVSSYTKRNRVVNEPNKKHIEQFHSNRTDLHDIRKDIVLNWALKDETHIRVTGIKNNAKLAVDVVLYNKSDSKKKTVTLAEGEQKTIDLICTRVSFDPADKKVTGGTLWTDKDTKREWNKAQQAKETPATATQETFAAEKASPKPRRNSRR